VNSGFYGGRRHTCAYRRVSHRCALELDVENRQPLTIHELATRDGLRPGRQRLLRIVGMAFVASINCT
jgi:hypothetical protein